jgi:methyl-accepting chemotaxis protein
VANFADRVTRRIQSIANCFDPLADRANSTAKPADDIAPDTTDRSAEILEPLTGIAKQTAGGPEDVASRAESTVGRTGDAFKCSFKPVGNAFDRAFGRAECGTDDSFDRTTDAVRASHGADDSTADSLEAANHTAGDTAERATGAFDRARRILDSTSRLADSVDEITEILSDLTADPVSYSLCCIARERLKAAKRCLSDSIHHAGRTAERRAEPGGDDVASQIADRTRRATDDLTDVAADLVTEVVDRGTDRVAGLVANSGDAILGDITDRAQSVTDVTADGIADCAERSTGCAERAVSVLVILIV